MSGNCFEIGTIQAFLDGETSPDVTAKVSGHIADCDRCASALALAEEESSVVFSALDREMDTLVPTQRLWNRINETIAEEKSRASLWQRLVSFAGAYLANPSFAFAAVALIVVGMFAAVWSPRINGPVPSDEVAVSQPQRIAPPAGEHVPVGPGDASAPTAAPDREERSVPTGSPIRVQQTNLPPEKLRALVTNADLRSSEPRVRAETVADRRPVAPAAEYLPGEASYVKTIADLRQNVDGRKDTVLSPSSRVSFERDMAVVDDSIKKMRDVVRKDPKNQAAKQVLYSSYQDKIDLLNSVAQREDLVASLR